MFAVGGKLRAAPLGNSAIYSEFDLLLKDASQDENALELSRSYRELDYRAVSIDQRTKRGQAWSRTKSSRLPIGDRARDLIVRLEITSEAKYIQSYTRPTWPAGQSGVTIGIGYDLGYVSPQLMRFDWEKYIGSDRVNALQKACNLKGAAAKQTLASVQQVEIPWQIANKQFDDFIPFAAGETEAVFPNSSLLTTDSFGALVSLVYNRGSAVTSRPDDALDRRKEMRVIRELMMTKRFADIPEQIRSMKRIWQNDPNARGLLSRRELEARLFEAGLAAKAS